jgi:ankyrin repeat protein
MIASVNGHLDLVHFLVLQANSTVNQSDAVGGAALAYASLNGRANIVRFLVTEGNAAIEARWLGFTSLMWAARKGHLDVVRILLLAGANVAPCLGLGPSLTLEPSVLANIAAAAFDVAGATAELIDHLPAAVQPLANVAAAAAVQAQEAWLMDALARALPGKCKSSSACVAISVP